MAMNVIVDYGCGNPASVQNMLKKVGAPSVISSSPEDILKAGRIIFPGVGSFDQGAENIRSRGIAEALGQRVLDDGVPILGICLGLQLFARGSEEGTCPGLGWIEGDVVQFDERRLGPHQKVPHMGWAELDVRGGALLTAFHETPRFYFAHSYYLRCDHQEDVAATARHGYEFCAAVVKGNIAGVQFHPEKSHRFGLTLFASFIGDWLAHS